MNDDVLVLQAPAPLTADSIASAARPLFERRGAERAYLIGSYARGTADAWSDVDLVVVMSTELPFVARGNELVELTESFPAAVDVMVYTPEEFAAGMRRGVGIFAMIEMEGRLIYER